MATFRIPVNVKRCDANCFEDLIANQITEGTTPTVGDLTGIVVADGGADEGVYTYFMIPQNYVGTPKLVIVGILDGAPSNGDDLGFGFRKRAVASNEAADGTFDAEQTVQDADIGGTGTAFSDEDAIEMLITLTAGDFAVADQVYGYAYIDASGTTYAGNFIITGLYFQYTDS